VEDHRLYQIALSKIPGVGAKLGKLLIAYCGGVEAVFSESKRRLIKIPGIGEQLAHEIFNAQPEDSATDLNYYRSHGIKIYFCLDDNYPGRLKHYEDAPLLFYAKGDFQPNPNRTVAIVGTRKPSPYGHAMCSSLVEGLLPYDVQIISGMAYGIDALAHKTANSLGIENLAVMGTGIDVVYPAAHRSLSKAISQNGAIITEYPINTRADRENFPKRNRVIAAMADVTVVVQSASRGGSLITAEYANQYFKDVFAFPGRVNDQASAGCNALIKQNKAHLIESVSDIGYIMRWELDEEAHPDKQAALFVELDDQEQAIVDLLKKQEEGTIDWLHHQTQSPTSQLSSLLLNLEFKGVIRSLPGKRYSLI